MKKILTLMMTILVLGFAGCSEETKKNTEKTLTKIVLTSNKTTITADGEDTAILTAKGYDQENKEMAASINIYKDNLSFTGTSLKTTSAGICVFTAKYGNITSNEITVTAVGYQAEPTIEELVKKVAEAKSEDKQGVADKNLSEIIAKKSYPIIEGNYVTLVYQGKESGVLVGVNQNMGWYRWSYSSGIPMIKIDGTDIYYCTMKFPDETRLDYRFQFISGRTKEDLLNPEKFSHFGTIYSVLKMPGVTKQTEVEYHAEINHGTLVNHLLKVDYKNEAGTLIKDGTRKVQVYLPYGYDISKVYKVLYFKDGSLFTDGSSMINRLDYLISSGTIEPVVAVFIDYIDRNGDYVVPGVRDFYYDYFINTLKPWIESNYAVRTNREDVFLIGASDSGFAVTEIGRKYSDKIKNILAFSPAYWRYFYGAENNIGFKMSETNFPVRMFISGGEFDICGSQVKTMYEFLKDNKTLEGLEFKMYNYQHGQPFYGDVFKDGITWLMDNTKSRPTRIARDKCNINVQLYWKNTGALKNIPAGTKAYFVYYKAIKTLRETKTYDNTTFKDFYNEPSFIQEVVTGKTKEMNFQLAFSDTNWGMWAVFYDINGDGKIDPAKVNWDLFTQNTGEDLVFLSDTQAIANEDYEVYRHLVLEY